MKNNRKINRLENIDILRGLVIILMALDHTRSVLYPTNFAPESFLVGGTALFMTRWVTHICAPVFVFLSGTSIFLMLNAGKSKRDISMFLLKRGLWLIFLEVTIVSLSWGFMVPWDISFQVIWAIGMGMIIMAALIHLPIKPVLALSILIIFGQNLLDSIPNESWFGLKGALFSTLYITDNAVGIYFVYPIIPWLGVMMLGYALGSVFIKTHIERFSFFLKSAAGLLFIFVLLRYSNLYGDANLWQNHETLTNTFLSFINITKYGPSLLFLLVTLGLATLFLSWLEKCKPIGSDIMLNFGRVPLFFYLTHLILIQIFVVAIGTYQGFDFSQMLKPYYLREPNGFAGSLGMTYVVWFVVVGLLYPICVKYAQIKSQSKSKLLAYL